MLDNIQPVENLQSFARAALAAGGKIVATTDGSGRAHLWSGGESWSTAQVHRGTSYSVTLTEDGASVASGGSGEIVITRSAGLTPARGLPLSFGPPPAGVAAAGSRLSLLLQVNPGGQMSRGRRAPLASPRLLVCFIPGNDGGCITCLAAAPAKPAPSS